MNGLHYAKKCNFYIDHVWWIRESEGTIHDNLLQQGVAKNIRNSQKLYSLNIPDSQFPNLVTKVLTFCCWFLVKTMFSEPQFKAELKE